MKSLFPIDVFRTLEPDFSDFHQLMKMTFPTNDYPNYPATNHYMEDDGTEVIEVAATGFAKDEIAITYEGNKVYIAGKKEKAKEEIKSRKTFCSKISTRSFNLVWHLSKFADIAKADAKFENCILTIKVPAKEKTVEPKERKQIAIS